MSHEVHIYTDGAAKGNPGPAGYGVVMEMVELRIKRIFTKVLDCQPIIEWNC